MCRCWNADQDECSMSSRMQPIHDSECCISAGAGVHPQPEEADVRGGHVVPTVRTHHLEVTKCTLSTSRCWAISLCVSTSWKSVNVWDLMYYFKTCINKKAMD